MYEEVIYKKENYTILGVHTHTGISAHEWELLEVLGDSQLEAFFYGKTETIYTYDIGTYCPKHGLAFHPDIKESDIEKNEEFLMRNWSIT